MSVPEITPPDAAAAGDDVVLLDVREPDEWDAGHVPGARHVPLAGLADAAPTLPRDRRLVVVCRSGGRSGRATEALVGAGFDAVNLAGGMQAWDAAGYPVVRDDGTSGSVV